MEMPRHLDLLRLQALVELHAAAKALPVRSVSMLSGMCR
jgi:hypothetical protein